MKDGAISIKIDPTGMYDLSWSNSACLKGREKREEKREEREKRERERERKGDLV